MHIVKFSIMTIGVYLIIFLIFFNKLRGPFTCDLFADTNNHKTNLFFSPYWCPGSGGVDAFGFNWSGHNCWIVPPVRLICRTISHLALCRGHGILIIPKWPSSTFWPLLWSSEDNNFKQFAQKHIEYVKPKGFFSSWFRKTQYFRCWKIVIQYLGIILRF